MKALNLQDTIEIILITPQGQDHLIRPLGSNAAALMRWVRPGR